MKGPPSHPEKIQEKKLTNSKRGRKGEDESNGVNKNEMSNPKLIEYYKVLIKDSERSLNSLDAFVTFKTIYNAYYLVYFNKKNSIISYDLGLNKKINEIKNAHLKDITKLIHYYDNYNQRNLVLSEDKKDNVKIWDVENLECICNLNFEEKKQNTINIVSLCFLKDNTKINIAIRFINEQFIRLYDISGKKIKDIKGVIKDDFSYLESYYDQNQKKSYIIISSKENIKSYDYEQNIVYKKYISFDKQLIQYNYSNINIYDKDGITNLLASNSIGIRIWNFHSGGLLNVINMPNLYNICMWDSEYIFARNGLMSLIELKTGKVVKKLKFDEEENLFDILSIKKGYIPQYENCLLTQISNGPIILWILKNKKKLFEIIRK